jgi:hypothetical protein
MWTRPCAAASPNVALQPTCGARLSRGGELRRRRTRLNFGVRHSTTSPLMISFRVLSRLRLRIQRWMLKTAPTAEVGGMEVVDWDVSAPDVRARIFHTAGSALESIRAASPLQFRRVQRSIRRVVVEYLPGANGIYCSDREAAVLSKDLVLRRDRGRQH